MVESANKIGVSIFFYAGDFHGAYSRFIEGQEQAYATHDQICLLVEELKEIGYRPSLYSFITPEPFDVEVNDVRFVALGGTSFDTPNLLRAAVESSRSEFLIPHFPNYELLRAVKASKRRSMAVLASSYFRRGLRASWSRFKLARQLNDPSLELVANHCTPSTLHLAEFGVDRSKLIAWDVPHRYEPGDYSAKHRHQGTLRLAYAGSVTEAKGVGDLIRAVALIAKQQPVTCTIAGSGDVEQMKALADSLCTNEITFLEQVPNNEVFAAYRNADFAVVPSRREFPEGFPLTMFEAIASRTPIVCSDHPIFMAILDHGENAIVFRNGDPASMAAAIQLAATDDEMYARLSTNAVAARAKLAGTADWKTLIIEWVTQGLCSPWIQAHKLQARG